MRKRARARPLVSSRLSKLSSHSCVSVGSTSGSWLGSPSLMTLYRSVLPRSTVVCSFIARSSRRCHYPTSYPSVGQG
jgi:hypothetical protein